MLSNLFSLTNILSEFLAFKEAFVAYRNAPKNLRIGEGEVLPFDDTFLNINNAFDVTTHKYTCSRSGLYLFSVSVVSYILSTDRLAVRLVKDGEAVSAALYADVTEVNQASMTSMVECGEGEQVWVEGVGKKGWLFGGYEDNTHDTFVQFSGTLIHISRET